MIVPLPTQSDDYVSYIQELVDEFAPGVRLRPSHNPYANALTRHRVNT